MDRKSIKTIIGPEVTLRRPSKEEESRYCGSDCVIMMSEDKIIGFFFEDSVFDQNGMSFVIDDHDD